MAQKLGSLRSSAYTGTNANQPPNLNFAQRDPTTRDINHSIGDIWLNKLNKTVWGLVSLAGDAMSKGAQATWKKIAGDSTHLVSLSDSAGDTVVANGSGPYEGEISLIGGDNITTNVTGANEITVNLDPIIDIVSLRISTLPAGVMQTSAGGVVTSNNGASGELLIAGGAAAPAWSYLESALGTMVIRDTANHINLEAQDGTSIATIDCDVEEAHPLAGAITISGNTGQLNTDGSVANTVTINLDDSPTILGTLTLNTLTAGVMQTDAAGLVSSSNGTDGQLIIADTAGGPAWGNITSSGGTIVVTGGANTLDLKLA
jgi:hypothetical protein